MAYNFITEESYDIRFDELEYLFLQHHLVDFQYQDTWIGSWLERLKRADQDTNLQSERTHQQNLSFRGLEIAQKKWIFPSFTFYFHFFIAGARMCIEQTKSDIHRIVLDRIQNASFALDWTPTTNWRRAVNNQKPVICTRFPVVKKEYLLIDGNHRLTAKIYTRQKSIKTYILSPQQILDYNILPAPIDTMMYLFLLESSNFSKLLAENKYTHQRIFDASFLHAELKDM